MPSLSEMPYALKAGMLVSPIALILTIVGMASPYWVVDKTGILHSGIWMTCTNLYIKVCISYSSFANLPGQDSYPAFIKATGAFEVLGCIVGGAAVLLVFACAFVNRVGRNKMCNTLAMVLNLVAGGYILLGVIIFSAKYSKLLTGRGVNLASYLGWAFELCIVGSGGFLITGCLLIHAVRQKWNDR